MTKSAPPIPQECETNGEAGREGTPDEQQLEFAAQEGRTFYTLNVRDFARLYHEFLAAVVHANPADSMKARIELL